MTHPTLDAQAVQALADLSQGVIKMAQEYKTRLASVPKAPDKAEIEKAAATLIEYGWVTPGQKEAVLRGLTDPTVALHTLTELVVAKAANDGQDPRLAGGHAVPTTNGHRKQSQALDGARYDGESEADRMFLAKQLARRITTN